MVSDTAYKGIGAFLILLGILIAISSWYITPVCEVQGMYVTTQSGSKLPMTCGFTARAEIGIGALIVLSGVVLLARQTWETRQTTGIFVMGLGAVAIALPTVIIGMCKVADHICRLMTQPTLEILGAIVFIVGLFLFLKKDDKETKPAAAAPS